MNRIFCVLLTTTLVSTGLFAQTSLKVQKADLSVPFGVAAGRLISAGDYLIFVDDDQPDSSFVIERSGTRDVSVAGDVLTIDTVRPVRDRSGERSKLNFRIAQGGDATRYVAWFKAAGSGAPASMAGGAATAPASAAKPDSAGAAIKSFQARHDHLVGGCTGRLILESNRLVYDSVTEINHSRQWSLKDIKELKRGSPYAVKIIPFSGDQYNLAIEGQGMDNDDYRDLVDRITAARTRPN